MNDRKLGQWLAAILLLGAILLSACQQSVSTAPLATATSITPTGLFVTPLTGENPMQMIEQFAQGTAAAQTAAAGGGTPTTPQAVSTIGTGVVGTPATATNIVIATTPVVGTQASSGTTTALAGTQIVGTLIVGTQIVGTQVTSVATTPVIAGTIPTAGPRPTSYTLQKGEFPYCIARRFNINPNELLSLNGLTDGELYYPNLTLKIPQTGNPFPTDRALHTHPVTYTVPSPASTVYGVACYFGDVDPAAIAAANGIAVSAALTTGQQLTIP